MYSIYYLETSSHDHWQLLCQRLLLTEAEEMASKLVSKAGMFAGRVSAIYDDSTIERGTPKGVWKRSVKK